MVLSASRNEGTAIVARIAPIAMTINNSIKVNPYGAALHPPRVVAQSTGRASPRREAPGATKNAFQISMPHRLTQAGTVRSQEATNGGGRPSSGRRLTIKATQNHYAVTFFKFFRSGSVCNSADVVRLALRLLYAVGSPAPTGNIPRPNIDGHVNRMWGLT